MFLETKPFIIYLLYLLLQIRISLRYMMGNLGDFDLEENAVNVCDMPLNDRYMLHLLYELITQVSVCISSILASISFVCYHTIGEEKG